MVPFISTGRKSLLTKSKLKICFIIYFIVLAFIYAGKVPQGTKFLSFILRSDDPDDV